MKKTMRLWSGLTVFCFVFNSIFAQAVFAAQVPLALPVINTIAPLSASTHCTLLRGLKINPQDPFKFQFLIDQAPGKKADKQELHRLISYFMAALTVPEKDFWVNLSPYEKNRVIPAQLSDTDFGRDLLVEDYVLKQVAASLTYPETKAGKNYWSAVHGAGTAQTASANNFNKVWIMPAKIDVFEDNNVAIVGSAKLQVLTEEDYLATQKNGGQTGAKSHSPATQAFKTNILPALTKDVNEGANFSSLRQMYYSFALALWFKQKVKDSFYKYYLNQNKTSGITLDDKTIKERVYNKYVEAFKKGVYDYIKKEEVGAARQSLLQHKITKRQYFSGGARMLGSAGVPGTMAPGYNLSTARSADGTLAPAVAAAVGLQPAQAIETLDAYKDRVIAHFEKMGYDKKLLTPAVWQEMYRVHLLPASEKTQDKAGVFKPLVKMLGGDIVRDLISDPVHLLGVRELVVLAAVTALLGCGNDYPPHPRNDGSGEAGTSGDANKDQISMKVDGSSRGSETGNPDNGSTKAPDAGFFAGTPEAGRAETGTSSGPDVVNTLSSDTGPFQPIPDGGVVTQTADGSTGITPAQGDAAITPTPDAAKPDIPVLVAPDGPKLPPTPDTAPDTAIVPDASPEVPPQVIDAIGMGPDGNPLPDGSAPKLDAQTADAQTADARIADAQLPVDTKLTPDLLPDAGPVPGGTYNGGVLAAKANNTYPLNGDPGVYLFTDPNVMRAAAGEFADLVYLTWSAKQSDGVTPVIPASYWQSPTLTLKSILYESQQAAVAQLAAWENAQLIADIIQVIGNDTKVSAHDVAARFLQYSGAALARASWADPANPATRAAYVNGITMVQGNCDTLHDSIAADLSSVSAADRGEVAQLVFDSGMAWSDFKAQFPGLVAVPAASDFATQFALAKIRIRGIVADPQAAYNNAKKQMDDINMPTDNPATIADVAILAARANSLDNGHYTYQMPIDGDDIGQQAIDGLNSLARFGGALGVPPIFNFTTFYTLDIATNVYTPIFAAVANGSGMTTIGTTEKRAKIEAALHAKEALTWREKFRAERHSLRAEKVKIIDEAGQEYEMVVSVMQVADMPAGGKAYRFSDSGTAVVVLPLDSQIQQEIDKANVQNVTVEGVKKARKIAEAGEFYYEGLGYTEENAHTLSWHALAMLYNGLSPEHLLQQAELAGDPELKAEIAAEERGVHDALIARAFTDEGAAMAQKATAVLKRTYGGVNLSNAKINVYLGAPVELKAPVKLVNIFKNAKRYSFEILSVSAPFTLR